MKYFLFLLALSIIFWVFAFPYMLRAYARKFADIIIAADLPFDVKMVKRFISILTWSNKWITNRVSPDLDRIRKLKVMLGKTQ
ncbi:hypothetical protein ES705_15672 [subsurface metagenome]